MVLEQVLVHPEFKNLSPQDKRILFAAALFHDCEKRSTTQKEFSKELNREVITAPSHAKKGEYTARKILYTELECPFEIREKICKIVRHHGLPVFAFEKDDPQKVVIETSLCDVNQLLAIFSECDMRGRTCPDLEDQLVRVELFVEICKENNCFLSPYEFSSELAKFLYFQDSGSAPSYNPFDNTDMSVHVMCGIPASGKDTFISNNLSHLPVISLDSMRIEQKVKHGDQKGQGRIIQEAKEQARVHLREGSDFIWNATNITRNNRTQLIDLFTSYKSHPPRIIIHYVESPRKSQKSQNKNREDFVPDKAVDRFINALEVPHHSEAHDVLFHIS
jgi:predicted kinase